jgi:hypothetical protein
MEMQAQRNAARRYGGVLLADLMSHRSIHPVSQNTGSDPIDCAIRRHQLRDTKKSRLAIHRSPAQFQSMEGKCIVAHATAEYCSTSSRFETAKCVKQIGKGLDSNLLAFGKAKTFAT